MNIVVLTAALSSLNSGLFTVRGEFTFNVDSSAPKLWRNEPSACALCGYSGDSGGLRGRRVPEFHRPSRVFEIVLNFASLGMSHRVAFLSWCANALTPAIKEGKSRRRRVLKPPGAPFNLLANAAVSTKRAGTMAFDYPEWNLHYRLVAAIAILLVAGWFGVRRRGGDPSHRASDADSTESVVLKEEAAI
ncbi:hypothetical protein KCP78_06745 [Salmonella enterica subsp. enterica]|nr:hypothetical protein KCP78_06745 [Salmonella enterica subsp. enterica]